MRDFPHEIQFWSPFRQSIDDQELSGGKVLVNELLLKTIMDDVGSVSMCMLSLVMGNMGRGAVINASESDYNGR